MIAGAILCGGKARRLGGTPKGLLSLENGQTIIARLLGEFAQVGIPDPVLLCGDSRDYDGLGKTVLPDRLLNQGPLGGIEAALAHYKSTTDAVLFATCDMPCITATELSRLIATYRDSPAKIVLAETCTFGWHPLCSVVHNGLYDNIREAIHEGRLAVHRLWQELEAKPILFAEEERFININSPDDLSRLRGES